MCSGVGDVREEYEYWLDGTTTQANTRAVNTLLARINELCSEIDYLDLSTEAQIERYNRIDLLVLALQFCKRRLNDKDLARAGRLLQQEINNGNLNLDSTDDNTRGNHLDNLFAGVDRAFSAGADSKAAGDFYDWWLQVIVPANRPALTDKEQARSIQFFAGEKQQPVGDAGEDRYKKMYGDIGVYLYNSAEYFLYLYIPEIKRPTLPYSLRKKIKKQQEVYDYCKRVFLSLYGSEDDMQSVIRTRIIAKYHEQPESVLEKLLMTKGIGFGDFGVAEIIALITAIASIVIPIIVALIGWARDVMVAKYAIPANIEDGCADEEDWRQPSDNSKLVKFGLIGVLLLLILKKK